MFYKKIILASALVCTVMVSSAFAPDCLLDFIMAYNQADSDHQSNIAWCDDVAIPLISHDCYREADLSFNDALNSALQDYNDCCCKQNLLCCD